MKRNNPDDESIVACNQSPNCVSVISSFFCPPTSGTAPSSGEAFIQTEFEKLNTEEQERIFRDLYGLDVSAGQMEEDDPNIIERKVDEMEIEIESIKSKEAYEEAKRKCPEHLEKTMLMFLRADLFDAKKAARRLIKYWADKVELFGFDRAMKGHIKQSDLDEADKESLGSGGLQILPGKDRGGRTIFWGRREFFRYRTVDNLVRRILLARLLVLRP
jgi:hypothetical protein